MRLFVVLGLSLAAVSMTFAQSSSKQVYPGANPAMPFAAAALREVDRLGPARLGEFDWRLVPRVRIE